MRRPLIARSHPPSITQPTDRDKSRTPRSSRLRSIRKRILVGGRAVDRRYRLVEQPQIDEQLTAVVVPVVQHDRANECGAWHGQDVLAAALQPPQCGHLLIIEIAERRFRLLD